MQDGYESSLNYVCRFKLRSAALDYVVAYARKLVPGDIIIPAFHQQ